MREVHVYAFEVVVGYRWICKLQENWYCPGFQKLTKPNRFKTPREEYYVKFYQKSYGKNILIAFHCSIQRRFVNVYQRSRASGRSQKRLLMYSKGRRVSRIYGGEAIADAVCSIIHSFLLFKQLFSAEKVAARSDYFFDLKVKWLSFCHGANVLLSFAYIWRKNNSPFLQRKNYQSQIFNRTFL